MPKIWALIMLATASALCKDRESELVVLLLDFRKFNGERQQEQDDNKGEEIQEKKKGDIPSKSSRHSMSRISS